MSTNGMTSWAVDLKDVGAIYPFQGLEWLFVLIGVAFWIWFHVKQIQQERREIESDMKADPRGSEARGAIERY